VSLRSVIDTNVWVSAIINPTGYPARLRKAFEQGLFEVVVSEPILQEIAEVLGRPKIRTKYGITEDDIKQLLTLIEERADYALLLGNINICRERDDNLIIETAISGTADFIVSRDDDVRFDS
jgi:uncharacterized protein